MFRKLFGRTNPATESVPAQTAGGLLFQPYRTLMDNLAAAVIVREQAGRIVYCSPFTEVLTGYPALQICATEGDFFLDIVHEEDREKYSRAMKVAATGEPFQFRYRFFHRGGIEMWAETRTVPLDNPQNGEQYSLSITLDMTATLRYQRQVEEKNRDLRDFTYMISHDLKSPIFTIRGMLQALNEDHASSMNQEMREMLGHMSLAANRLELLVKSVLELSKISSQELASEPIELSSLLTEVALEYQPQISETSCQLRIPPALPRILGDRLRISQVFSNLIGNAIKYRAPARAPIVEIKEESCQRQRYCSISVRDNGIGIAAEQLSDVFRPFHRLKTVNVEGTGIGLASVKRIMEKLGGEVRAASEPGVGSVFTLTFRRAAT